MNLMIEAKNRILDIRVDKFRNPDCGLFWDYGHSCAFCLSHDSEGHKRIWCCHEAYETSHHTIKSIRHVIKSIVSLEVYCKLRLYYSKVYDR